MSRVPLVAALGATQVIGYGSLYYAFPILAPAVAQEFGVGQPLLFGLLSAGLLLGGLAAPSLGGLIDRIGAGRVMTAGSLAMALLLVLLAAAPNIQVFGGLILLIELLSFAVLYDAAFALLAQKRPGDTRKAITRLTLIAGFASTLFWPLTGLLGETLGWRGTQLVFAGGQLLCAALHWRVAAAPVIEVQLPKPEAPGPEPLTAPVMTDAAARRAFWLLALGFALTGMAISAITVHLVEILRALDLGETAYLAAMAMGPSHVAVRVMDATVWRERHPLFIAILSASAIAAAIALLLVLPGLAQPLAFVFAATFGAGAGLSSIVRGAVPVALFGASGLGLRLGRLAAIRNLLGASSPFLFASAAAWSMPGALSAALVLALAGLAALLLLHRVLRRLGIVPPIRQARAGERVRAT